jgi:hypothetical protein
MATKAASATAAPASPAIVAVSPPVVLAYLDRRHQSWTGMLHAAAEASGEDPADQLVSMFDMLSVALRAAGQNGVGFLRTAAESAPGMTFTSVASNTATRHAPG